MKEKAKKIGKDKREQFLLVSEAANALRYTSANVRQMAHDGRIRYIKLSPRRILIPAGEVSRLLGPVK